MPVLERARDRGPARCSWCRARGRWRSAPGCCGRGCTSPTGALERLGEDELAAVVAHEAHHAARRDPLRILVARAIGDAYSLGALPRREQALARAGRRRGRRAHAAAPRRWPSALLAFDADAGSRPSASTGSWARRRATRSRARSWPARRVVIAALLVLLTLGLLVDGHPRVCLPLASAPVWWLCAVTARLAAMGPAWLGWRRAGAFLT